MTLFYNKNVNKWWGGFFKRAWFSPLITSPLNGCLIIKMGGYNELIPISWVNYENYIHTSVF